MTHLTLVRHGTTEGIERSLLHGSANSPLSARGRREAELAATRLKGQTFEAFYTSPQGRAMETAQVIARAVGLEPESLDGLREMHFGWLEGKPIIGLRSAGRKGRLRRWWAGLAFLLSAERYSAFRARVLSAFWAIAARHPGGRVLVVTHGGVHGALIGHLRGDNPHSLKRKPITWAPCAISQVGLTPDGEGRVVVLNDMAHLESMPPSE